MRLVWIVRWPLPYSLVALVRIQFDEESLLREGFITYKFVVTIDIQLNSP